MTNETKIFPYGTKVVDRDGYKGIVQSYDSRVPYYSVRIFDNDWLVGDVARFQSDLTEIV